MTRKNKVFENVKPPTEKICPRCDTVLPSQKFHFSKYSSTGLSSTCISCESERKKAWRSSDPKKASALEVLRQARYRARHLDKCRQRVNERHSARSKVDPGYQMQKRISRGIRHAVSNHSARGGLRTLAMLGYTKEDLLRHIEKQFFGGMSWQNMDRWHIDHIVPIASFDKSSPDWFVKAWGLPNLRPIWARENMTKNSKRLFLI